MTLPFMGVWRMLGNIIGGIVGGIGGIVGGVTGGGGTPPPADPPPAGDPGTGGGVSGGEPGSGPVQGGGQPGGTVGGGGQPGGVAGGGGQSGGSGGPVPPMPASGWAGPAFTAVLPDLDIEAEFSMDDWTRRAAIANVERLRVEEMIGRLAAPPIGDRLLLLGREGSKETSMPDAVAAYRETGMAPPAPTSVRAEAAAEPAARMQAGRR